MSETHVLESKLKECKTTEEKIVAVLIALHVEMQRLNKNLGNIEDHIQHIK